ncbi:sorting nexin 1 [Starmerella bacillaris]|uniref:Sorting nexin 1 n=1 Tax=Starmerella bacillaris TaxID=1247836 RepID=A0AAV5RJF7_STABA|nr:sorting nexin 1 [Starmerella bacillaris]
MADYFGDESPWGAPLASTTDNLDLEGGWQSNPFVKDTEEDDPSSQVVNDLHSEPSSDNDGDFAARSGVTSGSNAPDLSSSAQFESSAPTISLNAPVESAEPTVYQEPVVRPRNAKKKRNGGLKIESATANPLGESVSKLGLDDVQLNHGVASPKLSSDIDLDTNPKDTPIAADYNGNNFSNSNISNASSVSNIDNASESINLPQLPLFKVTVSDPQRVGDLTNTHTEFTINMTTDCPEYEVKESCVQRRYREFVWLYNVLIHKHAGVVVPPPPEKQALGRFNEDFVQQRRQLLEQMLRKIVAHPLLYKDADVAQFLTSTDFQEYLKTRITRDEDLTAVVMQDDVESSTGSGGGGSSGFIGTLSGALSLSRGPEIDPWTVRKRQTLDQAELQLQKLLKSLNGVSQQRRQLSDSLMDFSNAVKTLGDVEPTNKLGGVLKSFAKIHARLAQIYERLRQQDLLSLETMLSEHLRLIGSMRHAVDNRQRVFTTAEASASDLERKQDKLNRAVGEDKILMLEEQVDQQALKAKEQHQQAARIAKLVEHELQRVSNERMTEFRNAVELYMENAIEAQKESIEVWENFYTQHFA